MANFRRDRARRSYRSMASNAFACCESIVANLSASGVEGTNFSRAASAIADVLVSREPGMVVIFSGLFARESQRELLAACDNS